jgi:hypothetical protein
VQRHARAVLAAVATTVIAGGLLAGCGGGEPDRVSARALARQGEAVCADGQKEADRLRNQADPGAHGEAAAKEIDATRAVLETQIQGFEDLRGPESTDADLDALVRHYRAAADGLETLRDAAADDDLTVDEAIQANADVVQQVNRSSAQGKDDLVALGWLTCVGIVDEG